MTEEIKPTPAFELYSTERSRDPHKQFAQLRQAGGVAHADELGGYWILTRYRDVVAAAQNPGVFSSRYITIPRDVGGESLEERPPITLDPPRHQGFRRTLIAGFSPGQANKLEPEIRKLARNALSGLVDRGGCDAAEDYAKKIPVGVMCTLMGVPMEMERDFFRWANDIFESGDQDRAAAAAVEIGAFFDEAISRRKEMPREDLISVLSEAEYNGMRLSHKELVGALTLVLIAGLDTVWSVLSNVLLYLGQNRQVRRQLIENPDLLPTAVEEFLRYFAPASLGRVTTEAVTVGGVKLDDDATVLLAFPSANRDAEQFDRADEVVLDRSNNSHLAFGVGAHRCLGMHIARLELTVAISEWLRAIPDYEIVDPEKVEYSIGQVWGPRSVPVRF